MTAPTAVDRMRDAYRGFRIDQPDSFSYAVYGPNDFFELHDTFASAVDRRDELGLLAALKSAAPLSNAMIDAASSAMKSDNAGDVWQAFVTSIASEYEARRE